MNAPFKGHKSQLPGKTCQQCWRTMRWRKAWAKNWAKNRDEVNYGSDACRSVAKRGRGTMGQAV
ncbi:MAG: DUF2256 domain-containing protein [Limnohabitans sp.]